MLHGNFAIVQFFYPITVISNGIHHLNGPVCMVRNKIVALSFYFCLGLVLYLSETGFMLSEAELEFSGYCIGYSKARIVLSIDL